MLQTTTTRKTLIPILSATLIAGTLTLASLQQADAATPVSAYTTATINKIADGTGHGTPAQTFITSENNFAPADDSPTDGVVSSGDTVTYDATLTFTAGPRRDVRVHWDMSQAPFLKGDTSYCTSGQQISARVDGQDCIFTVNAGAVETITRTLTLTAADTGGTAKANQLPILAVSRENVANAQTLSYRAAPVTVVSAPAVDVELLDHPVNYNAERKISWQEEGTLSGYFDIVPRIIRFAGRTNSHGSSLGSNTYSGTIDVSAFPEGSTFSLDSTPMTPSGGKISLTNLTGIHQLRYQFPAAAVAEMSQGESRDFLAQLSISKDSFAATEDDALLNNGDGSEPGTGKDQAYSTYDSARDIRRGYPYPNNNWSRAWVYRNTPPPPGQIFAKNLYRPYSYNTTVFDDSRQSLANGESRVWHSSGDEVATGAEIRTELYINPQAVTNGQGVDISDTWTDSVYKGSLKVTSGGQELDPSSYTVYHSDQGSGQDVVWVEGAPTAQDRRIRVVFPAATIAAYTEPILISFVNTVTASAQQGNRMVPDTACVGGTCVSDYVRVIAPTDPSVSITHDVTGVHAPDGSLRSHAVGTAWVANPGDTVDYVATPRMQRLPLSGMRLVPEVRMTKPAGVINPRSTGPWTLSLQGDQMIFRLTAGSITPIVDSLGNATLPEIRYSAMVANPATGTLATPATVIVDVAAKGTIPATQVTSNTATASVSVNPVSTNSAVIHTDTPRVEINDQISWTFNLYASGQYTGRSQTVLRMPSTKDAPMEGGESHTGLDGSWNEYDRGHSAFHGGIALSEPVSIVGENSTHTEVVYSTDDKFTDDPSQFTWKTWNALSASERAAVTAVKVVSDFMDRPEGQPLAAANGTIRITPSGNTRDDRYVMWLGRTYFEDGTTGALPWGDVAEVVAGSITGLVWWDNDESSRKNGQEEPIGGITMSLFAADDQGKPVGDSLATAETKDDGTYLFDVLHSGSYVVTVARTEGAVTDSGVQTKTVTYYNQEKPVTVTRSYRLVGDKAGNESGPVRLGAGATVSRVDFGFAKPDPKAQVDKRTIDMQCGDASCQVSWDVEVRNQGKTTAELEGLGIKPVTISAGGSHSLALDSDGHLYTWGYNNYGQLGDGTTTQRNTPTLITPDHTYTAISARGSHSMALDSDGHLWTWGYNRTGGLGDGTTTQRNTPTLITPDHTYTAITAGGSHSMALDSDGHLWTWGYNNYGQLGDRTATTQRTTPTLITPDRTYTAISAGVWYSMALDSDGHLWTWGYNDRGQLGDGTTTQRNTPTLITPDHTYITITAGGSHSMALDSDGHLWAWGYNDYGQLGASTTHSTPTLITPDRTYSAISAGEYHSMALDSTGHLYTWGYNGTGGLGDGTTTGRTTPMLITPDRTYSAISAGEYHSMALDSDGHLWTWGYNDYGQLGDGTTTERTTPTLITPDKTWMIPEPAEDGSPVTSGTSVFPVSSTVTDRMSDVVRNVSAMAGVESNTPAKETEFKEVIAGKYHSMALDTDGHLYTWGANSYGRLGDGTTTDRNTPTLITPDRTYTTISASTFHSMALDSTGHLWTWGNNFYGRLGDGTTTERHTPTLITPDRTYTTISAGGGHSMALDSTGHLWTWGNSSALGDGTTTERHTPTLITPDRTYTTISAGNSHSMALDTDGHLWTWGGNSNGQFGDGTRTDRNIPTLITPDRTYSAISAGVEHSMALDSDGHLWTWGTNYQGRLGDGTRTDRDIPTLITPDRTYTTITAGAEHSMALDSDGHLWTWGYNNYGQLGDGTRTDRDIPTLITPDRTYTAISAGVWYSMALDSDGHLWTWGYNDRGQLGDGTTFNRNTPTHIILGTPAITSDPTAVPVTPIVEATADGYTTRTYNLPFEVHPGGKVVYHFTGTILRSAADRVVPNQAWFDSPDTPYAGTPHAREARSTTPGIPDTSTITANGELTGTPTCRTGSDYKTADDEHLFSTGNEDSCDMVAVRVPKLDKPVTLGSLSGVYWGDTNRDGVRQDSETERFAGQTVYLLQDGNRVAETTTDDNGAYAFNDLVLGTYSVQFSKVGERPFTASGRGNDRSLDSDASTVQDTYGASVRSYTLTTTQPRAEHVDAGVLTIELGDNDVAVPTLDKAEQCGATDTVTVPEDSDRVAYTREDTDAGVHVVATAKAGYSFAAGVVHEWTLKLETKICPVEKVEEPKLVKAEQCGVTDTYTVPADTDALDYSETREGNTVHVTVAAKPGYALPEGATTEWTLILETKICPVDGELITPEVTKAQVCGQKDMFTLPADTDKVHWSESRDGDVITVTATPKPGYSIAGGKKEWTLTLESKICPVEEVEEPKVAKATECGAWDTFTVPADTDGIHYEVVEDKEHHTVKVTATAKDGYAIPEDVSSTWDLTLARNICPVPAKDIPAPNPVRTTVCGGKDTFELPADTDSLDWEETRTGDHIVVTLAAKDGYSLPKDAVTRWEFDLETRICPIVPVAPALEKASQCGAKDTVNIPAETDSVRYEQTTEGDHVTIRAVAKDGYILNQEYPSIWEFDLETKDCPEKPADPVVVPAPTCGAWDTVTIPANTDAVTFTSEQKDHHVTVTATAKPGHSIDGKSTKVWEFDLHQKICPVEKVEEPKVAKATECGAWDTFTVPADTDGIHYEVVEDKEHHTVKVTATAKDGYTIPEDVPSTWDLTLARNICPVDKDKVTQPVLASSQSCGGTDTVTVPDDSQALDYEQTVNGTHVTVTVKAKDGYAIPEGATTRWEFDLTTKLCPVTPVAPELTKATECGKTDTFTLPAATDQYSYAHSVDEKTGEITVTATAKPGFVFDGEDQSTTRTWTLHPETKICPVTPVKPTVNPAPTCGEEASLEVAKDDEAVRYEVVADEDSRMWTVTAHIAQGYNAAGEEETTWAIPMPEVVQCPVTTTPAPTTTAVPPTSSAVPSTESPVPTTVSEVSPVEEPEPSVAPSQVPQVAAEPGEPLAMTGSTGRIMLVVAFMLMLAGGGLYLAGRRRVGVSARQGRHRK